MTQREVPSWHEGETEETSISSIFRSSFPPASVHEEDFRLRAWKHGTAPDGQRHRTLHQTVLHALAAAAHLAPTVGITLLAEEEDGPERFRSYADLYRDATTLALNLKEVLSPGERCLLVMPTSFEFVAAFFAVQMVGAIPVPAYPPALLEKAETALERMQHIAQHSGAVACITSKRLLPLLGGLGLEVRSVRHLWAAEALLEKKGKGVLRVKASGRAPAFIQYTSGSTGHPKGVLLTHRNLVANIHATGQAAQVAPDDTMVSWLPLYHDMGLIGALLFPIYWKLPLVLMSPTVFLTRPVRWLQAISQHRGTFAMAPNFAFGMCVKRVRPSERHGLDLSSWRVALNGAEPVNVRTLRDFSDAFAPHGFRESTHYPCYGLAESTVAVTFSKPGAGLQYDVVDRQALAEGRVVRRNGPGSVAVVGVGTPIPGHDVAVVDAEGVPVRRDEVGHVLVRGAMQYTSDDEDEELDSEAY